MVRNHSDRVSSNLLGKRTVVVLCVIIFLAGCSGFGATDSTTAPDNQTTAPPTSEERAEPGTTDDEQGIATDLRISNSGNEERTVRVTVTADADGTIAFDRTITVAPNESREFDLSLPDEGGYVVEVDTNETKDTLQIPANPDSYVNIRFKDTETEILIVEP